MNKYNLDTLNSLIKETAKLIDEDPLTSSVEELALIKKQFDAIQNTIQDESIKDKSKWIIASIFSSWSSRDEEFVFKTFEWKINSIFEQFDLVHESVDNTIEMYVKYSEWLSKEINLLSNYIDSISKDDLSNEDIRLLNNYEVMKNTLQLSYDRIKLSLTSAWELSSTMEITRPIFQAVLSSCLIEVSGQKTLDSSIQMNNILSGTIDALSDKLTKASIDTSKTVIDITTKPLLWNSSLNANIKLLGNALEELNKKKVLTLETSS